MQGAGDFMPSLRITLQYFALSHGFEYRALRSCAQGSGQLYGAPHGRGVWCATALAALCVGHAGTRQISATVPESTVTNRKIVYICNMLSVVYMNIC